MVTGIHRLLISHLSSHRCQTDRMGNRAWQVASQQGCEKHHQKEETVQAQRAEKQVQRQEIKKMNWTFWCGHFKNNYSKIVFYLITRFSYFSSCCLTMSFGHSPGCHEFQTTHWICNKLKNRKIHASSKSDISEEQPLCGKFYSVYSPPVLRSVLNSSSHALTIKTSAVSLGETFKQY